LEGASREEAAKIGGMDRQTLRDWVIRFNEQGADGLINIPSPGMPPKLNAIHKAFLARIVEEGPIAAIRGVVRWRACDLIMRLYEEFGLSVSDDTVYRALKNLGFSHVSARPKAYKQNADAMHAFKKTAPSVWRRSARSSHPTHRYRSGSKTRCGWAKRTSSPIAGPGKVHAPVPPTIKGPNRPTCSVRSAPNAEPAPPSCCRPATPKLCSFTSMRSQPKSRWALTLFSVISSWRAATAWARASSVGGTSRPSALAVLRLIIVANLVDCSTGMSSGLVPLIILSTKTAARRGSVQGASPPGPPEVKRERGKEGKIQGVSVRPTRKPKASPRATEGLLSRMAERRKSGSVSQGPPRTTRMLQLPPAVHAEPSTGGFPA